MCRSSVFSPFWELVHWSFAIGTACLKVLLVFFDWLVLTKKWFVRKFLYLFSLNYWTTNRLQEINLADFWLSSSIKQATWKGLSCLKTTDKSIKWEKEYQYVWNTMVRKSTSGQLLQSESFNLSTVVAASMLDVAIKTMDKVELLVWYVQCVPKLVPAYTTFLFYFKDLCLSSMFYWAGFIDLKFLKTVFLQNIKAISQYIIAYNFPYRICRRTTIKFLNDSFATDMFSGTCM